MEYIPYEEYRQLVKEKLNTQLLWKDPYNELRKFTRLWFASFREEMLLRQFETSYILSEVTQHYPAIKEWVFERLKGANLFRAISEERIKSITKTLPEWEGWAKFVPGIGELSFGKLLGIIGNPAARAYPSNLWRFCGLAVTSDGTLEKPKKGEKATYCRKAKSQLWLITSNILRVYPRSPSFYGVYYYVWRERYTANRQNWTPLHCHLAAVIKVAKLFISHLWEVSRRAQGLPVPRPYPIEFLNHKTIFPYTVALHPVKARKEVIDAIESVKEWLAVEEDQGVAEISKEIVEEIEKILQRR